MCGICGYSGLNDVELLKRMSEAIAHRGPDGDGMWYDEDSAVGLAHRRLAIIDLSQNACQPMTNEDKSLWLTYSGEVYNFQELREGLLAKGHTFRSRTDSEVLLHLYEEDGPALLERLNGVFAFALWDGRRHELLLARDGMGVRPLYYCETSGAFLFASELKALLQSDAVSREIDPAAIHYHLAYLWAPAPSTMLRQVKKLPPGTALVVRDGRVARRWRYYDIPYDGKRLVKNDSEIAGELAARIKAAVKRQLVSDVPMGAMLSGGLDSSAVVAMAMQAEPSYPLRCYTIAFAEGSFEGVESDLPYARRVAKHLGVDLHEIIVEPRDIIQHIERVLYHLDEPQADPAPINVLLIAEQARRDGVPVLLSGSGGDDILGGYRRHAALTLERYWAWLPQSARSALAGFFHRVPVRHHGIRRLAKAFGHAGLPPSERLMAYFCWSDEAIRRSLYGPRLREALANVDTAAPLRKTLARIPDEHDPLNRMLFLEGKHFLCDHNLNYADKALMAAGVEGRVPLIDREVVSYAVQIPTRLKQRGLRGKIIYKKAMEPYLPRDVIYRSKSGFGAPIRIWLRSGLREMVEDVLSERSLGDRGFFDPQAVRDIVEKDRNGQIDAAYTIFSLMCIELWCRIFIDRPRPSL